MTDSHTLEELHRLIVTNDLSLQHIELYNHTKHELYTYLFQPLTYYIQKHQLQYRSTIESIALYGCDLNFNDEGHHNHADVNHQSTPKEPSLPSLSSLFIPLIQYTHTLTSLTFDNCQLKHHELTDLLHTIHTYCISTTRSASSLHTLHIPRNQMDIYSGIAALKRLYNICPTLTSLDISGCFDSILLQPPQPPAYGDDNNDDLDRDIVMDRNTYDERIMKFISHSCYYLKTLVFNKVNISVEDLSNSTLLLWNTLAHKHDMQKHDTSTTPKRLTIESLTWSRIPVHERNIHHICDALQHNTTLKTLIFTGAPRYWLDDIYGSRLIHSITKNTSIASLEFSSQRLQSQAAVALANMIAENSTLKHLNVSSNRFDLHSVSLIIDTFTHNSTLTSLDLSYNPLNWFSDSFMNTLIHVLKHNTTLQHLSIQSPSFYDSDSTRKEYTKHEIHMKAREFVNTVKSKNLTLIEMKGDLYSKSQYVVDWIHNNRRIQYDTSRISVALAFIHANKYSVLRDSIFQLLPHIMEYTFDTDNYPINHIHTRILSEEALQKQVTSLLEDV